MTTPATAPPPGPQPDPLVVGKDGCPIRAIAFSSGGFETAMQLGVTHALLVIQGKSPDAAVGISAGAISAVAMAEILQAEPSPATEVTTADSEHAHFVRTLEARVKRFRDVLDGYQRAPSELIDAAKPDALQLNARIPLKPLELPIHHKSERTGRNNSLQARAGLINLYNHLLELRMSWGAITRFVRRGLGIAAAPELRPSWKGKLAVVGESVRAWILLGSNLLLAAPLLQPLSRPFFHKGQSQVRGETAGTVIFRSQLALRLQRIIGSTLNFVLLSAFWFGVSFLAVIVVPLAVTYGLVRLAARLGWDNAAVPNWIGAHQLLLASVLIGSATLAILVAAYWHRELLAFVKQVFGDVFDFVVLLVAGLGTIWVVIFAWLLARQLPFEGTLRSAIIGTAGGTLRPLIIAVVLLTVFAITSFIVLLVLFPKDYARRLLASYDLANGLLSEHPLRQLLISILDPEYYGTDRMDDIVDRALRDETTPSDVRPPGRLIGDYSKVGNRNPIHIGVAVANVASGNLETIKNNVRSVNALLAATAITPLFPPQQIDGQMYVDGTNISAEATRLVTNFLRPRVNPNSTVVHIYTVFALPFTRRALGGPVKPYLTLIEVVARALQLQRFRDASLERRLTELYTHIIPPSKGVRLTTVGGNEYLRAWVTPIEPERPLAVLRHLLAARDKVTRRKVMARTVADGCRAALEVMIRPSLGPPQPPPTDPDVLTCRFAVNQHLVARRAASGIDLPLLQLPGSDPQVGPGLSEVCSHCALQSANADDPADRTIKQSIRVHPWSTLGPAWPHEMEIKCEPTASDPHFDKAPSVYDTKTEEALLALSRTLDTEAVPDTQRWPRARASLAGSKRPLVTLLFSGGVFRGVYQMGVLTALSEADVQPDIIAGASVGSITAALVAESFSHPRGQDRDARIAREAATYLALDRLVLTDRFADFIRNLTLRGAASGFSLRQVDRFLRRYDMANANTFDSEARLVMAGLERLLYVSPFELKDLVKAFREQDMREATRLLHRYLQDWLDHMGCGNQLLGSEPLALVITEHVLTQMAPGRAASAPVPFDAFLRRSGIYFLATATNLTRGRLEVLGEQQLLGGQRQAVMLEGLLASSAFPAVFRPRWAWELMPGAANEDQYIDGGLMDNLPLDVVAQFLLQASRAQLITPRPIMADGEHVPHLLFSASLEKYEPPLASRDVEHLANDWVKLFARAKVLKYNKKLDSYAEAQHAVRDIWETVQNVQAPLIPLDLDVVTVIPKWLCGTFAFHPMLGFRRARQAESIAHGCASTLIALGHKMRTHPEWTAAWGVDGDQVPTSDYVLSRADPYEVADDQSVRRDHCWLRPQTVCPFSRTRVDPLALQPRTVTELEKIHLACRKRQTHAPH